MGSVILQIRAVENEEALSELLRLVLAHTETLTRFCTTPKHNGEIHVTILSRIKCVPLSFHSVCPNIVPFPYVHVVHITLHTPPLPIIQYVADHTRCAVKRRHTKHFVRNVRHMLKVAIQTEPRTFMFNFCPQYRYRLTYLHTLYSVCFSQLRDHPRHAQYTTALFPPLYVIVTLYYSQF